MSTALSKHPEPRFEPPLLGPVDVNACRNPVCPRFGDSDPDGYVWNRHLLKGCVEKVFRTTLRCKVCKATNTAYSNRAVAHIAKDSLARHLPVNTCTNESCDNYWINLFDHPPRRAYSRNGRVGDEGIGNQRVQCSACNTTFTIGGTSLIKKPSPSKESNAEKAEAKESKAKLERFWLGTLCGLGPKSHQYMKTLNNSSQFRGWLSKIQKRCTRFNAFQGIQFWNDPPSNLYVYTDFMEVGLKFPIRSKLAPHHLSMHVAVSVLRHKRRLFLLGITPGFQPMELGERITLRSKIRKDLKEHSRLVASLPYAHLRDLIPWGPRTRYNGQVQSKFVGLPGSRTLQVYTALGHFHMLRTLLRNVPNVYHYIDQADDLRIGVLSTFAKEIRENRCEVTLVSREKSAGSRLSGTRNTQIDRGIREHLEVRCRLTRKVMRTENRTVWREEPTAPAIVHRRAMHKHRKPAYDPFWVRALSPGDDPVVLRTFWATFREGATEQHEREIMLRASLNPVDSCINAMRTRLYGVARPISTASGFRGYRGQPELPGIVIAVLDLFRCRWNYCDVLDKSNITRAQHYKLAGQVYDTEDVLYNFRVPDALILKKKNAGDAGTDAAGTDTVSSRL